MEKIKYETRTINITNNPTFIVGQCPGKTTKKALIKQNNKYQVFSGNQTGTLVNEIIKNNKNLYLTNIFNYYTNEAITQEIINQGLQELQEDIYKYQPATIICLGKFAEKHVKTLQTTAQVYVITHPSYVLRFQMNKEEYTKNFRALLK